LSLKDWYLTRVEGEMMVNSLHNMLLMR